MSFVGFDTFSLDKRGCVQCPDVAPSCPPCAAGYVCQQLVRSCDTCQSTTCAPAAVTPTPTASPSSPSPNVPAIAGGVVGGIVAIIAITYLVWRLCIKKKRDQYEKKWVQFQGEPPSSEKDFASRRDARASTHTMNSVASSVLTRASNIIQIAYIPGVTNRSTPSTPGRLVPPVPAIPISLNSPTSTQAYEDQHFFIPGDLRDSTYSGMTDRTSRTSYARNSVASTIYGKNTIVSPLPAQTVIRGKAAVVSVKPSGGNTPGELTPPVPSVDLSKYNSHGLPSPAFSVGSTFLNNATSVTQMKPQVVSVTGTGTPRSKLSQKFDDDDDEPQQIVIGRESGQLLVGRDSEQTLVDHESRQSMIGRESIAITLIEDTPSLEQGPFSDPPTRAADLKRKGSLSAVIEESTKKAQGDVRSGLGLKREMPPKRDQSPFGDEHATDS